MKEKNTKEWLGVFGRLNENQDFKDAIEYMDQAFSINGSVFQFGNLPNPAEMLFAREGARTFRNKLVSIEDELKQQLEEEQKEEKQGEDNE